MKRFKKNKMYLAQLGEIFSTADKKFSLQWKQEGQCLQAWDNEVK